MNRCPDPKRLSPLALALALVFVVADDAGAERLVFDRQAAWGAWTIPAGLVEFDQAGTLNLVRFRRGFNAALDAVDFSRQTQSRGEVNGGIWRAGSGAATAANIIDGDPDTFWRPAAGDELVDWVVDIDLGRPVFSSRLRLRFPDTEGARPFEQFSVFVATGARTQQADDVYKYEQVFTTTQPNKEAFIEVNLSDVIDTTQVLSPGIELEPEDVTTRTVQLIRFKARAKSPDAALSEIEIQAVGDNVSIGVLERGGGFEFGQLAREPENMFDGDMDSSSHLATSGGAEPDWRKIGIWWQVDLGALFWVDELFLYFRKRGEGLTSFLFENFTVNETYHILASEGQRTISGDIDYEPLIVEPRWTNQRKQSLRHYRYLFAPRKVRYLFWYGDVLAEDRRTWRSQVLELMLFSPGYPAEVTLRSDFIDLGQEAGDGRPKAIRALHWDSEQPAGTNLRLRSRAGNSLSEEYTYTDRAGQFLTEAQWNSKPKVLRGPVDTTVVTGDDWGEWSNLYQVSGEPFQSETPRRYVQLELILSTEDPAVAPSVRSLEIDFEEALVQVARGQILPRQVEVNEDTRFRYTLWPQVDVLDSGFDRLRFGFNGETQPGAVEVRVGGRVVEPVEVRAGGDSLLVDLPELVRSDSVEIAFSTRVLRNASVFTLDLGNSGRAGVWQSVEPESRNANVVYLPGLAGAAGLIGDLQVTPAVFTPNGDGVNDALEVRFALLKVTGAVPTVDVYDLAGRRVASLATESIGDLKVFGWDGRNAAGGLVPPGTYVCRIEAGGQAGKNEVLRTVGVGY